MDITITFNPLPGDIIDVSNGKQLPTRDIITVNMDGGVGGSWKVVQSSEPKLKENQQEPLDL